MGRFDLHPDLAARCQDITLRHIPAERLDELGDLVLAGLFDADEESTLGAWYDPSDLTGSARRAMAYHLRAAADARPQHWDLLLGVYLDDGAHGQLIGVQGLHADDFGQTHTVRSSSFLAPGHRGRGYGIVARQAGLAIAFNAAGARWAVTSALATNEASVGVSLACGYLNNGVTTTAAGYPGKLVRHFLLPRKIWEASTRPPVHLEGFGSWAEAMGLPAGDERTAAMPALMPAPGPVSEPVREPAYEPVPVVVSAPEPAPAPAPAGAPEPFSEPAPVAEPAAAAAPEPVHPPASEPAAAAEPTPGPSELFYAPEPTSDWSSTPDQQGGNAAPAGPATIDRYESIGGPYLDERPGHIGH